MAQQTKKVRKKVLFYSLFGSLLVRANAFQQKTDKPSFAYKLKKLSWFKQGLCGHQVVRLMSIDQGFDHTVRFLERVLSTEIADIKKNFFEVSKFEDKEECWPFIATALEEMEKVAKVWVQSSIESEKIYDMYFSRDDEDSLADLEETSGWRRARMQYVTCNSKPIESDEKEIEEVPIESGIESLGDLIDLLKRHGIDINEEKLLNITEPHVMARRYIPSPTY